MAADVLELLVDIKEKMIAGEAMDVGIAFRIGECIAALKADGGVTSQDGAGIRTTFDSVESVNSIIRDGQPRGAEEPQQSGGIASALGGMFRRE